MSFNITNEQIKTALELFKVNYPYESDLTSKQNKDIVKNIMMYILIHFTDEKDIESTLTQENIYSITFLSILSITRGYHINNKFLEKICHTINKITKSPNKMGYIREINSLYSETPLWDYLINKTQIDKTFQQQEISNFVSIDIETDLKNLDTDFEDLVEIFLSGLKTEFDNKPLSKSYNHYCQKVGKISRINT